ncbi:VOC family protein [Ekhidna sp.]|uniref:VOC family protein n=1 Tax=Ekhidna sp. TaxID=2608089 RepID=UPI003B505A32
MASKITGTRYVLAVQDLSRSIEYYHNILGMNLQWEIDGWALLDRDNFIIMLGECKDDVSAHETNNHSYFGYIEVSNIDALFEDLTNRKVEVLSTIETKPWGQREFGIRTIDGHRIMFGEEH